MSSALISEQPPSYEESERINCDTPLRFNMIGYSNENLTSRLNQIQSYRRKVVEELVSLGPILEGEDRSITLKRVQLEYRLRLYTENEQIVTEQLIHTQVQSTASNPMTVLSLIDAYRLDEDIRVEVSDDDSSLILCYTICFSIPICALYIAQIIVGSTHDLKCDKGIVDLSTWLIVYGISGLLSSLLYVILILLAPKYKTYMSYSVSVRIYYTVFILLFVGLTIIGSITFWGYCYNNTPIMWISLIMCYINITVYFLRAIYFLTK